MNPDVRTGIARRLVQVLAVTAFQAAILFLAAGKLDWLWAWVFFGLYLAGMAVNAGLMLRANPETIAERSKAEGMKDWDKVVGGSFGILYFLATPLVAGLDERFGWSGEIALGIHLTAALAFALGFAILIWGMVANTFFSTVVRIQEDRGHAVCDTGPYRFVRHPGYVGVLIHCITVPLILGSWWAMIPGVLGALFMIARTALEDRTLQQELGGYSEYATKVRYRLLPGVW